MHIEDKVVSGKAVHLYARAGAVGVSKLDDKGEQTFVELRRLKTHTASTIRQACTDCTRSTCFLSEAAVRQLLVVAHTIRGSAVRIISARIANRTRGVLMSTDDDMRDEYDFSNGTRGKYAAQFVEESNIVVLDPDVA